MSSFTSGSNQSSTDGAQNRQRLSKMLQFQGYSACREALALLGDHFSSSTKYESLEDFIYKLNRVITFETNSGSSIIDPDLAHTAIQKLISSRQRVLSNEQDSEIINPDDNIPLTLSIKVNNVQCDTKGTSDQENRYKDSEFNIHYNFLFKKLCSLPIFQEEDFKLIKLSTLTASSKPSLRCICFGLLVKDISKIDGYMLIDSSGRVPVRITADTTFRNRLAYTNCIVLVEGVYVNPDDILFAANIGLPPILLDPIVDKSLACINEKLVVILKELFLDDEDVCNALDMLFTGYNSMEDPPVAFILIGDFTRQPCDTTQLRVHMKKLVRILRACENLKECHFIIVPGLRDTSYRDGIMQESKMPKVPVTKDQMPVNLLYLSNFQNVHFATNPCHIYLGERLISVVSHSYIKALRNNLLHDLSDHREELFETAKQIMLSNAHLTAGISRAYHSSMNLWHRPDLLVLADSEAFGSRYDYSSSKDNDTSFCTVPSFARQFSQFKVYYVKSGEVEDSQVSSDAVEEIEELDEQIQVIEQEQSELE